MKPQARQALLGMVIPMLVIGTLYLLWKGNPLHASVTKLRADAEAAERSAPKPLLINNKRSQIAALGEQVKKLTEGHKAVELSQAAAAAKLSGGVEPTQLIQRLSALFKSHGLTVIEESPTTGQLSPTLTKVVTNLGIQGRTQMWQMKFVGRYANVAAVLKAMSEDGTMGIPLAITMEEAPIEFPDRVWTLMIWI